MKSTLIVLLNVVIVFSLCTSIVQFWRERWLGSETIRELAALSALVTLFFVVLIYSGEFLHQTVEALRYWGVSGDVQKSVLNVLRPIDEVCTDIANAINRVLGAAEVGYRPDPPRWPAVLLVIGYLVRFLIYRFQTRKGNRDSALTGAVYWSYITAYVMTLAYLIVVADFDATVVVPVSLAILAAIVVGVKVFFEDFGLTLRAITKTLGTEVARAAARVAYLATEIAGFVREALAYANKFYIDRVRAPLRRGIDALEERNKRARGRTEDRMARQNAKHAKKFKRPG